MATVVLGEDFESYTEWVTSGTITSVAGKNGLGVRLGSSNSSMTYSFVGSNESNTITVGFYYQVASISAAQIMLTLKSDATSTNHLVLSVIPTGILELRRGYPGTVIATSAAGIIAINTWYFIEIQAKLHDTTGFATVRLNGVDVISFPAGDTKNAGSKTTFDSISINVVSTTAIYDDCYAVTGTDGTFKGEPPWSGGEARLARTSLRSLTTGIPIARMAKISVAGVYALNVAEGQLAQIGLKSLLGICNRVWLYTGNGTQPFDIYHRATAPVMIWNDPDMMHPVQICTWNGSAFVSPVCPEPLPLAGCTELLMEPFNNLSSWVVDSAGTPSIVSGRTGTALQLEGISGSGGEQVTYPIQKLYHSHVLTLGFAWRVSGEGGRIITGWASGGYIQVSMHTNETNGFDFRRGPESGPDAPIILSTADDVYAINTWYYIELQIMLGNSGYIKMQMNGSSILDVSDVDTRGPTTTVKFNAVGLGTTHDQVQLIDDLYLLSGVQCTFRGDIHIT